MKTLLFFAATLAVFQVSSRAQDKPIEPDQFDFASGTGIVSPGTVQMESGVLIERDGDARTYRLGDSLLRVPLNKRSELRASLPFYRIERDVTRQSGIDDLELAARFLVRDKENFKIALQPFVVLPTGSSAVSENRYQPGASINFKRQLNEKSELVINLGGQRASDNGRRYTQVFAAASYRYDLNQRVKLLGEIYGFNQREADGPSQKFVSAGAAYLLDADTALYARFGVGLNNQAGGPSYLYGAGLSKRF